MSQCKYGAAGFLTALKWFTKFVGCSDSTLQAESIKKIIEGDKRFFVQERMVSDDLTPDLFNRLMMVETSTAVKRRAKFLWTMLYYTGARLATARMLRLCDFNFEQPDIVVVFVQHHKTDMYRKGFYSTIQRETLGRFCPVKVIEEFFKEMGISQCFEKRVLVCPVVRRIYSFKEGKRYCQVTAPNLLREMKGVSESVLRKDLKATSDAAQVDLSKQHWLTPKSARSGCVSSMAQAGVPRDVRQRHVNWKGDDSANLYARLSAEQERLPSATLSALGRKEVTSRLAVPAPSEGFMVDAFLRSVQG